MLLIVVIQSDLDLFKSYISDSNMALVIYNEDSLPVFHKPNRRFRFFNQDIVIPQAWGLHGVAGVVWDAVSHLF